MKLKHRFRPNTQVATSLLLAVTLCLGCSEPTAQQPPAPKKEKPEEFAAAPVFVAPPPSAGTKPASGSPSPSGTNAPGTNQPGANVPGATAPNSPGSAASTLGQAPETGDTTGPGARLILQAATLSWFDHQAQVKRRRMIGLTSNNNIALLNESGMSDLAASDALAESKFPMNGIVEYLDTNGTQFLKAAVLEGPDLVRISNDPPPNLDVVAPIEPPKPAPPKQPDAPRQIASTLPLPGEVTAAVTGSKGRYLVLTIPSKKSLVVVDVREMQIRKTIAVKSADVQVASSASRFVVLDGKSGPLDCYDFDTLEIERSKAIGGKPFLIAMSEFGEGPLWVVDETTPEDTAPKIRLFDLETLSPVNVELASPDELLQDIRDGSSNRSASVSRDGDAICIPSWTSRAIVWRNVSGTIGRDKTVEGAGGTTARWMPDGQTLLGDSRVRSPGHTVEFVNKPFYAIPFNGKNDCLSIQWQNVFGKNSVREASPLYVSYHPKLSQAPAFVSQLAELGLAAHEDREREQKDAQEGKPYFPYSRRISYFPRAKVLSYIASNPARALFFTKHDFAPGSDKRPEEWVFEGMPFTRGASFLYQLPKEVAVAEATFELDSAPAGMTISKEGQLAWTPPADGADRISVIVGISRPKQPRTLLVVRLAADKPTNPDPEPPPITAATSARTDPSNPSIQGYGLFTNDIGSGLAYIVHPLDLGRSQIFREEPVAPNPEAYVPSDAVTVINSKPTGPGSRSYRRSNGQGIHVRVVSTPFRLLTPVAPGSKEIKSTWIGMQEPTAVIPLPEKITDAVPAGDGRYLLLAQPTMAKVAVFDVREAKVTGYVDVDSPWIQIAGGATRFVVYDSLTRKLRRFDLATRALQQTATLEEAHGPIFGLAMGVGSEGPIYFVRDPESPDARRLDGIDLETLKPRDLKFDPKVLNKKEFCFLSASADGRTVVWTHETAYWQRLALQGETLELIDAKKGPHFTPRVSSLDGRSSFQGPRREFQSGEIVQASNWEGLLAGDAYHSEVWYATGLRMRGRRTNSIPIQFFVGHEPRPVAEVEALGSNVDESSPLLAERRIHCTIPEKTIALIGDKPPRVSLTRFEFDAAVAATSSPPLVVSSSPPTKYPAQETLTYQLEVAGKPSGLKYRLDSGPDDMTVSPTGLVSWKGPTGSSSVGSTPERGVMITVSDAAGREAMYGFRVPSSATNDFTAGGTATLPVPPTEADLVAGAVVALPFRPTETFSAGDGRYLLFVFREFQKLAIFDLVTAKIVRYLELESPRSIIAGGLTRLVVVNPTTRQISRYRLETGEREKLTNYPGDVDGVVQVEIGTASEGPLLMWDLSRNSPSPLRIVDLETLAVRQPDATEPKSLETGEKSGKNQRSEMRLTSLSGDGRTFALIWRTGPASNSGAIFNFEGDKIVTREETNNVNSDSQLDYDGQLRFKKRGRDRSIGKDTNALTWSAGYGIREHKIRFDVYRGENRTLLASSVIPTLEQPHLKGREYLSMERGYMTLTYAPHQKTFAVIVSEEKFVAVKRFDAEAEIAKAGANYVTIMGAPPEVIRPGEKLSYQFTAMTNHPPLLYQLLNGIKGMTISGTGLLEWTAPKTVIGRQEYRVRVVNSQGIDQVKTFTIAAQHTGISTKPKTPAATGTGGKPAATGPTPPATKPAPTATGAAPAATPTGTSGGDPALAAAPRKWTSSDGKFSMTGTFVELRGANVAVKGTDGKTIEVPIDRLSAADQTFIKSLGPPK